MDSDRENHLIMTSVPPDVPLTIEIDEEKPAIIPFSTPSDDSEPLSSPGFHSTDLIDGEMKLMEATVASAVVASEKAKLRQLSTFLEKWVGQNNNNLYPSRAEKEDLGRKMGMTYIQVNRWFANRRRKVMKRPKVAPSPASVTTGADAATPAAQQLETSTISAGRIGISLPAEHLSVLLHALSAQPGQAQSPSGSSSSSASTSSPSSSNSSNSAVEIKKEEMVMQNSQAETPLTPPADLETAYGQVVPEMSQYALEQMVALQKVLNALPHLQQQTAAQLQAFNPAALALLGITPIQLYQAQLLAAQQHLIQVHLMQQEQAQRQQMQQQNLWMQGGSISASPAHISDSEISEMSELSPPPRSSQMPRPHSPFKDPHGIADTDYLALMSLSKLSEREQLAVNILMEFSTDAR